MASKRTNPPGLPPSSKGCGRKDTAHAPGAGTGPVIGIAHMGVSENRGTLNSRMLIVRLQTCCRQSLASGGRNIRQTSDDTDDHDQSIYS